ncbi:3-hydroxybutyrate oligomer hydrolase family protein [Paucibacter sp. XJ19-41]|uniref:3-hydroxybutyrate oligomer hydrolase family protein n=1 Tax=Paucibacter sp. XJ19-41 TaxID=2927824 RepID=UPI00234BC03D|nr:3-hydroxybutyrate oligomer hydrolase family protein [Paucibacter sp. XJ19-41]MDC6168690.1 3-hydroxybutyrate oligomer hydrolase family protein [Paucibacter sp. XJ19-41]
MKRFTATSSCLAVALLSACGGSDDPAPPPAPPPAPAPVVNTLPSFVSGAVAAASYDGASDDLLTGGLGKTGLLAAAAPAFANPLAPTVAEARRNAIFTNYRALVDYTASGGFGRLYGPNIDNAGADTLGEGKVAGSEHIAVADDGSGKQNVVMMVQVPAGFDATKPCIVSATSSGSRGVYGAIGTAGEWGLKRGCAVAYVDKGSGNGLHDLTSDNVIQIDGTIASATAAAKKAHFKADLSEAERLGYNAAFPNRVAYKHAHSQQNPEKDWGRDTLRAIKFAFYVLNEKYGKDIAAQPGKKEVVITPANTTVIASSVSNGGGAALAAAEQDTESLIDGVAVTEPNAQPGANTGLTIKQGAATVATHSKPLIDYFTFANIYQPCAALSAQAGLSLNAAFWPAAYTTAAQNRCAALKTRGLLAGASLAEQADEALAKMNAYGWMAETNYLQQSHFRFATNSIVMTYVNSYGRFKVTDNVCGFSYANTNATGDVVAQVPAVQASLFSGGNGVPPTSGVNIVYNDAVGGAKLDFLAVSPTSATADFALDGALCMRALVTAKDPVSGAGLFGNMKAWSDRVIAGMTEVQLSAKLRGLPTIIVAGRNDTLIPVNHAGRAYYGKNLVQEAATAKTRYYEVTNAQHFDSFIAFGALLGYETRYIPLHVYFVRAMDQMWAHLKNGTALPASQVVRTTPRAAATALAASDVPPWAATPAAADAIAFDAGVLSVPQ